MKKSNIHTLNDTKTQETTQNVQALREQTRNDLVTLQQNDGYFDRMYNSTTTTTTTTSTARNNTNSNEIVQENINQPVEIVNPRPIISREELIFQASQLRNNNNTNNTAPTLPTQHRIPENNNIFMDEHQVLDEAIRINILDRPVLHRLVTIYDTLHDRGVALLNVIINLPIQHPFLATIATGTTLMGVFYVFIRANRNGMAALIRTTTNQLGNTVQNMNIPQNAPLQASPIDYVQEISRRIYDCFSPLGQTGGVVFVIRLIFRRGRR